MKEENDAKIEKLTYDMEDKIDEAFQSKAELEKKLNSEFEELTKQM